MDEKFDEPIYLLTDSMNCYVIEDKRHDNQNQIEGGEIEAVYKSDNNTDIFRSFPLPYLPHEVDETNLVVINSFFYMLGGYYSSVDRKGRSILIPKPKLVRFCDLLDLSKPWQIGPSFPSPQCNIQVATSNNGSIAVIGKKRALWLQSLTSSWEKLPKPPESLNVNFMCAQILALTATHIYLTVRSITEPYTYGLRFSLVSKEWEIFDKKSFNGSFSQGVVLYDSYLVVYRSFAPDIYWEKGFLGVYDLNNCCWMIMDSVVTTNSIYKKFIPPHPTYIKERPILFQVAQNKLAIVWQELYHSHPEPYLKLYCTKFILHKTFKSYPQPTHVKSKTTSTKQLPTHAKPQPSFYFEFVSHGAYHINTAIISPSVRVTLADERRTKEEQCHG